LWLIPVILATEEAEIRRMQFNVSPGIVVRLYIKKQTPITKKALVELLKV
jgi:hypothetical protein